MTTEQSKIIAEHARELKNKALPLKDAITFLIETVDRNFPQAHNPEVSVHSILQTERGLADAFSTVSMLSKAIRFNDEFDETWRKDHPDRESELYDAVLEYVIAEGFLPLIIGFAAGLRTAGFSKTQTETTLWNFTRHLHDETEEQAPPDGRVYELKRDDLVKINDAAAELVGVASSLHRIMGRIAPIGRAHAEGRSHPSA